MHTTTTQRDERRGQEQVLPRARYPFDREFYEALVAQREGFASVSSETLSHTGHGFRVDAGQAFRLTLLGGPQILDVCFASAEDPHEHFFTGAQMAIEGGRVTRFTRLWGTPPRSRPLATCIADSLAYRPNERRTRDHFSYGAHCNAHLWHLYTGVHHRPCYDNLRYGFAMLGLHQRYIHDNVNLFQRGGYDPFTGAHLIDPSDAAVGDHIEFYAEVALAISVSICPNSGGSDALRESWSDTGPEDPVYPIRVEVMDTNVSPLGWPYEGTGAG
jgi:uncharacterized protein YcgI (DUF1989 family)